MMSLRLPLILTAFGVAALHAGESSPSAAPVRANGPTPASALSAQMAGGLSVDPALLHIYSTRVEAELKNDILPFWLQHTRDRQRGGFYGEISNDLVVDQDAPRGALLTSRILWTFSAAYRQFQDPACLEMARWAYDDLLARFWDNEQGGLFWSVTADGKPLDTYKGSTARPSASTRWRNTTAPRATERRWIARLRCIVRSSPTAMIGRTAAISRSSPGIGSGPARYGTALARRARNPRTPTCM